ncbi:translation initiation factor IF-2-like [Cervus elaphus]|uniref:translation initiation factor IF-2-like n=1 Tax=Cervus elaphus TaxID=9860 RepID=UPI001CC282DD|nr:translation initiation factor IF-2-like [Cervus elaphus]
MGDEENLVLGSCKNRRPSETSWGPAGNLWPLLRAAELDQEHFSEEAASRVLKAERIANVRKKRARRSTSGLWCRASRDPSARGRAAEGERPARQHHTERAVTEPRRSGRAQLRRGRGRAAPSEARGPQRAGAALPRNGKQCGHVTRPRSSRRAAAAARRWPRGLAPPHGPHEARSALALSGGGCTKAEEGGAEAGAPGSAAAVAARRRLATRGPPPPAPRLAASRPPPAGLRASLPRRPGRPPASCATPRPARAASVARDRLGRGGGAARRGSGRGLPAGSVPPPRVSPAAARALGREGAAARPGGPARRPRPGAAASSLGPESGRGAELAPRLRDAGWRSILPPAAARFCGRAPNCRLLLQFEVRSPEPGLRQYVSVYWTYITIMKFPSISIVVITILKYILHFPMIVTELKEVILTVLTALMKPVTVQSVP